MSVTIYWKPNTEADIASYGLQRANNASGVPGVFADLATVVHNLVGPNYDAPTNRFFYVDSGSELSDQRWYRLRSTDLDGNNSLYSDPFQATTSAAPPPFTNQVALTHNFGGADALQYVDPDNQPIANAQVRVYKKADFDLNQGIPPLATTTTDTNGRWVNVVYVEAGFTYVIQFFKQSAFGPDNREVVVP
jgi:hypothetical protein